jgi:hypothetical protein
MCRDGLDAVLTIEGSIHQADVAVSAKAKEIGDALLD